MLNLLVVLTLSPARAEPSGITLEDAVAQAERAPGVLAAGSARDAARAGYAQAWPGRLPSLSLQGNVLVYNEEQQMELFSTDEPMDCTGIPDPFGSLCSSFGEPIIIREQVTSSVTAQVSVPLTGQFAVDRQVAAAKAGLDAAKASESGAIADAQFEARDAWFAAVQAEQQLAIAEAQARSMTERTRIADVAFGAGTLTRNDLLLVRISASQAKLAVVQLSGFRDLAYARLGMATAHQGEAVRPVGATDEPPRTSPDAAVLVERALDTRPEIVALNARITAARASAAAASWARLPSISGMGVYSHATGQGALGSADTAYVGASMNWTVWAWGKAAAGVTAARAQTEQLSHQLESLEAGVRMDVLARLQALTTAGESWRIAEDTVEQASENLTIQEQRQQMGDATMQEVLDADVALVRARSTRASALFDARRAESALVHAVGADPWR